MLKNKIIPTVSALCVLSLVFMAISLYISKNTSPVFTPPKFDETAVSGVPDTDAHGFGDLTQDGMAYSVFMCSDVLVENQSALVYFTNPAENTVWLKIRLFNKNGDIIGETGIVKPGEYIKSVVLFSSVENGESITVKVMGYEPETYRSAGAVSFNTKAYTNK